MAHVEINIYGDDDSIINTFSTNHIRWGLIVTAVELQEKIDAGELSSAQQIKALNEFVLSVFPTMTLNDVEMADVGDIFNVFKIIGNMSGNINTKNG